MLPAISWIRQNMKYNDKLIQDVLSRPKWPQISRPRQRPKDNTGH